MEKTNIPERRPKPVRKTYCTPELASYGNISHVTRGMAGTGSDGGAPGSSMMCWIAEALYGVDAPRTLLVRAWLTECFQRRVSWALAVVPLYRRFGRRLAGGVKSHAVLRWSLKRVFDFAVLRAHQEYAGRIGK